MLRNIFLHQRWTEAFIPHRAMRRHVHWVLNTKQYSEDVTREWKKAMLNELNFVGIVAGLVATIITSFLAGSPVLSWPVRALFLSALLFVLISISIAAQYTMTLTRLCYNPRSTKRLKRALQKIAKEKEKDTEGGNREGGQKSPAEINVEGEEEEQATTGGLQPSRMQLYAWQIPVVLLAVAVLKLVIGLNIWVFEAAVAEPTWGDDKKTAVFFGVMAAFATMNFFISCAAIIRMGSYGEADLK